MLVLCALALLGSACRPRFTNANLQVVNREFDYADEQNKHGPREIGVSPKQVESILGPPQRIETTRLPLETQKKEVDVVRYYYNQDGQTIEVHFFDNKLISRLPLLGASKVPESQP